MKPRPLLVLWLLLSLASLVGRAQTADGPVDFARARALFERQREGGTLTADERAYLKRARAEREKQTGGAAPNGARPGGQRPAPAHLVPLTDFTADARYAGRDGGLYGAGRTTPPEALRRAAEAALAAVQPLDTRGRTAPDGKIGFVSLSMSNATQEFSVFKRLADASPQKSPRVVIVDCAQGGQAMAEWAVADGLPWRVTRERLSAAQVAPAQVQVAWIKLANKGPTGSFAEHTAALERDTLALLQHARALFPNLRLAYLGSRIYGGYATNGLNPEPYAYEGAFAVRGLIQRQAAGTAPVLLWGPYLWADGPQGRRADHLVWERADFGPDGTHPSESGRRKVAELLLTFFTTDALARPWFTTR